MLIFVAASLLCSGCGQAGPQPATTPSAMAAPKLPQGGGGVSLTSVGDEVEVEEDYEDEAPKEHVDAGVVQVKLDADLEAREQAAMEQASEEQRAVIKAVRVQRKAVRRSHRTAAKMKKHADSLHVAVRRRRFYRLEGYAKKQGWSVLKAPPEAVRDARLKGWWQEWWQLKKMGLELR